MEKRPEMDIERELDEIGFRSYAVYVAGNLLIAGLDLNKLADMVTDMFVELLRVDLGYLMLFDGKSGELSVKAVKGLKQKQIKKGASIGIEKDVVKRIIDWKKPVLLSDLDDLPLKEFFRTMSEGIDSGISLYVPLVFKDEFVGLISLGEKESKEQFNQKDLNLLSTMCGHVAVAIVNAKLYEGQLNSYLDSVVSSLAEAIESKDPYTRGHSDRVSKYAAIIARGMNLTESEIEGIRIAGILHDIGKIGIPEGILLKFAPLTHAELGVIKEHPVISAKIMKKAEFPWDIVPFILHHHERFDGGGYPDGLNGEDIPLGARLLAVADTYEALLADRPYRRGFPKEKALEIIKEAAGVQLDPEIVPVFLDLVEKGALD
ncbi:MAG: HD domain-containing phosphohydrolase [Pseudomonadota bacterium]